MLELATENTKLRLRLAEAQDLIEMAVDVGKLHARIEAEVKPFLQSSAKTVLFA